MLWHVLLLVIILLLRYADAYSECLTDDKMISSNSFYYLVITACLISACGSGSLDNQTRQTETEKVSPQGTDESSQQPNSTELVATSSEAESTFHIPKDDDVKAKIKAVVKDELSGWQTGRVQFLNLEGGFYGIITESGKKLLPMNIPKEFAQNGAVIRVKGKEKNVMTIQQWGTPFTITDIELLTPGSHINDASK